MNSVDIVIAIALVIGVARGFSSGIIRQLADIIGIIFSILLAVQLMGPIGDHLITDLGWSPGVASVVAFLLVFITIQIGMFFLARLIERVIGLLQLTILNRIAGALFGGFKAALLVSVVLMVLITFETPDPSARESSVLYDPVASLVPETWDFVAEYLPVIKTISDEFGREVEELVR